MSSRSQNRIATGPLALTNPSFRPLSHASWLASQVWLGLPMSWHGEAACCAVTGLPTVRGWR